MNRYIGVCEFRVTNHRHGYALRQIAREDGWRLLTPLTHSITRNVTMMFCGRFSDLTTARAQLYRTIIAIKGATGPTTKNMYTLLVLEKGPCRSEARYDVDHGPLSAALRESGEVGAMLRAIRGAKAFDLPALHTDELHPVRSAELFRPTSGPIAP